jgi:hypothetical protein
MEYNAFILPIKSADTLNFYIVSYLVLAIKIQEKNPSPHYHLTIQVLPLQMLPVMCCSIAFPFISCIINTLTKRTEMRTNLW